jgi:hypothetical protein
VTRPKQTLKRVRKRTLSVTLEVNPSGVTACDLSRPLCNALSKQEQESTYAVCITLAVTLLVARNYKCDSFAPVVIDHHSDKLAREREGPCSGNCEHAPEADTPSHRRG